MTRARHSRGPVTFANEKTKLTPTWLNTLGGGSIIIGVLTPIAAASFGTPQGSASGRAIGFMGMAFFVLGLLPHAAGRAFPEGSWE